MATITITITTPPSKLPVGATPGDDWSLRRQKGNRVRYQNNLSAAWDKAFSLEPGDVLYRELDTTLYGGKKAPASAAKRMSDNMGVIDPTDPPLELDDMSDVPSIASYQPVYATMTRDRLRQIAADRNIKGRSSMSKAELIVALQEN